MALMVFSACEKEPNFEEQSLNENQSQQTAGRFSGGPILADLENGRLIFKNQTDFDQTIASLKDMEEADLQQVFEDYYNSGFVPLYPYYEETETDRIMNFLQKKKALMPKKFEKLEYEFDDILISDDLFASLLNYKREIVLDGEIIKYTFSAALIVQEKDSLTLQKYVKDNNINDFIPDPLTLRSGLNSLTSEIEVYVSPKVALPPDCFTSPQPIFPNPLNDIICDGVPSYGGNGSYEPPASTYTNALLNYVNDLMPCNMEDAGIFGLHPFGTRKVCFENFSGNKRRTKTLYSNEDYWIYTSIQVKIKHQRHHTLGPFASWWAAKVTDEVALIINDAVFRITPSNMTAPPPPGIDMSIADINVGNMVFYSGGLIVDPTATGPEMYSWPVSPEKYPSTPFNEEVIVQYFNENISFSTNMNTTVDQVTNLFWSSVYDLAVAAGNKIDTGGETTKITMLLSSPTSTIVHHVDLSRRKLITKKIKYVLDEDWGGSIKFNISLNGNGQIITDPEMLSTNNGIDVNFGVDVGNLTQFDDIYMNFTGVSRRGSEWRGSNMVYKALDQN